MWRKRLTQRGGGLIRGARRPPPHARTSFCTPPDSLPIPIFCHRSRFVDFPDVPVRLSGGTLGGGGGCLGSGLGAQASVTSFPTTLEPWQVLQLFVVGDFWTCSCHARGAPSGGKMSISHGCGGLMRALGHEKLPWRVVLCHTSSSAPLSRTELLRSSVLKYGAG